MTRNFRLHPLIHTLLKFNLAPDIGSKKSRAEAPQCSLKMNSLNMAGMANAQPELVHKSELHPRRVSGYPATVGSKSNRKMVDYSHYIICWRTCQPEDIYCCNNPRYQYKQRPSADRLDKPDRLNSLSHRSRYRCHSPRQCRHCS